MGFEFQLLEHAGIQLIDGDRGKNYPKEGANKSPNAKNAYVSD